MIKELEWDSNFWNIKIADCVYENDNEINEYLNNNNVDLIQAQVNINKTENIRKLENLNFRFIDLNITFCISLDLYNMSAKKYIISNEQNIKDIENIAVQVFINSRYNVLSIEKTKEFYKLWARKSVLGKLDDVCLIEKDGDGQLEGFVTIKKISNDSARIGLIGVNPAHQNNSVGTKLINQAKNYLAENGIKNLFVSTQGSNIRAQNFYIRNGFKVCDVSAWLYLFLSK